MSVRVEFRWPDEFVERVDAAAGDVPRSVFVRRAVERALDLGSPVVRYPGKEGSRPSPAPAEQPVIAALRAEELRRVSPSERPENQYVSVYDHNENAELPPPPERRVSPDDEAEMTIDEAITAYGVTPADDSTLTRVSPPKPVSPRVPFRRDVKPFQRGDK